MNVIRTVLGDRETVGWCQCHEHLFMEDGAGSRLNSALLVEDYEKSLADIEQYKLAGGCAFVDAMPINCGRMADYLVRASEHSGVDIVACTGFHKKVYYDDSEYIYSLNEDIITQLYIDEIKSGMNSSKKSGRKKIDAKAGIIKVAVDTGGIFADNIYEKLATGAVLAAKETGAPIMAHIEYEECVFELVEFMAKHGLEPNRLIASHLDRARKNETEYHKQVAKAGVFIEYDSINRLKYLSHEEELTQICAMVESGYADKLLFSLDTTAQRLSAYGGATGLDYILKEYSKMLDAVGVGEQTLKQIMVDNANNALRFK